MLLARRNLLKDKTRLALSVGGVALAVMLVLVLGGLLTGSYRQITGYLDHAPASVVVAQHGVSNMLGATSLLPPDAAQEAAGVAGAANVTPILSQFVILDLHGKKQPAYLIGYDPVIGGGPWQMAAGRAPAADDEVVLDRVLAERHDLGTGNTVKILGQTFAVVGLSDGTTSWMTSFFFIRKSAAEALLRTPGATSFLLVTPVPGVTAETLRDRLAEISGVDALLKPDMAANDLALFARFFAAPLKLMTGIAFLVGALVVGLVIYTATVERQREYGVLKAIGARNTTLYQVVVFQALIAAVSGVGLGILLAYATSEVIMTARPQFLVVLDPSEAVRAVLVGLGMALAAALMPAHVVSRLAPAEVFRR
jgi:putative ABC transport system permease protein